MTLARDGVAAVEASWVSPECCSRVLPKELERSRGTGVQSSLRNVDGNELVAANLVVPGLDRAEHSEVPASVCQLGCFISIDETKSCVCT